MAEKSLFNENDCWVENALELDALATRTLKPIITNYLEKGFSIREIGHILVHTVIGMENEFALEIMHKKAKVKKA